MEIHNVTSVAFDGIQYEVTINTKPHGDEVTIFIPAAAIITVTHNDMIYVEFIELDDNE